jgi:phage replication O-like protein O
VADVQLENGYTRIANELLEAVCLTPFIATHLKIILLCWRFTYGFGRKQAELSVSFISKATGISRRYVSEGLNELIKSKVLTVIHESTYSKPRIIAFNKNYKEWEYRTPHQQVNPTSTGEPQVSTTDEPHFTTTGELQFTQERNNKEKINKEQNEFFEAIWKLYPNKKGKGRISKTQIAKLHKIGFETLKKCIDRYKATKEDWKAWQQGSTFFNSGYIDYLDENFTEEEEKGGPQYADLTGIGLVE